MCIASPLSRPTLSMTVIKHVHCELCPAIQLPYDVESCSTHTAPELHTHTHEHTPCTMHLKGWNVHAVHTPRTYYVHTV